MPTKFREAWEFESTDTYISPKLGAHKEHTVDKEYNTKKFWSRKPHDAFSALETKSIITILAYDMNGVKFRQ
jgi:hypothetical protein